MRNHVKAIMLFVIIIVMGTGCSASFEEEQKDARLAVEEAFHAKPVKPNKATEDLKYYLPFGFKVIEEYPNNILIKNGGNTYILFYNPHENSKSEIVLDNALQQNDYDVQETFRQEDKLGFLLIKTLDHDKNEVTVGIGGVKLSSEVKTSHLKLEVSKMMTIVHSVVFTKK